jgi:MscS family membrane protein
MDEQEQPDTMTIDEAANEFVAWVGGLELLQVAALAVFVLAVFLLRKLLARGVVGSLELLLKRHEARLSEDVQEALRESAEVLLVLLAAFVVVDVLSPPDILRSFLDRLLGSVAVIVVFSAWYRLAADFVMMLRSDKRAANLRMEADWTVRVSRFAVLLFGVTALLKVWAIDISAALTGVGVLGAGLAIASQDLVRNLIAGMTNISEERFVTGDAIHVEGLVTGTVERIDLRSTLIMGFDQVPRYVPNAELANCAVLNYSRRKHRRIKVTIGLVRSATVPEISAVREGLEDYLLTSGDFDTSDDAPKYVRASEITDHAINILFYGRTNGGTYQEFLEVSERLNLRTLEIVAASGTKLAYPTQTIFQPTGES